MELADSGREQHLDQRFEKNVSDENYSNRLFLRIVAKKIRFENVDFRYTIFDTCYFRNCVFDSCDFTGCRFAGVNFYGSSFTGCKFDYSNFERTIIDAEILDTGCPGWENIKLKFARTLRTNFQQIGDSKAVNKAIKVELDATEVYLMKSWRSNEAYYRKKYKGIKRIGKFFEWFGFKILDFIWGNGESTLKLMRFIIILFAGMTFYHVLLFEDVSNLNDYWKSFVKMPSIFLGIMVPENYSNLYTTVITLIRLVSIGFFLSILIKKFNKR